MITPVAAPSVMTASLVAFDRFRVNRSVASEAVSPLTVMVTVWVVWPSAKVRVPEAAV